MCPELYGCKESSSFESVLPNLTEMKYLSRITCVPNPQSRKHSFHAWSLFSRSLVELIGLKFVGRYFLTNNLRNPKNILLDKEAFVRYKKVMQTRFNVKIMEVKQLHRSLTVSNAVIAVWWQISLQSLHSLVRSCVV